MVSGWTVATVAAIGAGSAVLFSAVEKAPRAARVTQTGAATSAPVSRTWWQSQMHQQLDDATVKLKITSRSGDHAQTCHQARMMGQLLLELAGSYPAGTAEQAEAEKGYRRVHKITRARCGF